METPPPPVRSCSHQHHHQQQQQSWGETMVPQAWVAQLQAPDRPVQAPDPLLLLHTAIDYNNIGCYNLENGKSSKAIHGFFIPALSHIKQALRQVPATTGQRQGQGQGQADMEVDKQEQHHQDDDPQAEAVPTPSTAASSSIRPIEGSSIAAAATQTNKYSNSSSSSSSCYLYDHPIRIEGCSINTKQQLEIDEHTCHSVSISLLFNLALAHQHVAMKTMKTTNRNGSLSSLDHCSCEGVEAQTKAIYFYEATYRLLAKQQQEPSSYYWKLVLATFNNMAIAHEYCCCAAADTVSVSLPSNDVDDDKVKARCCWETLLSLLLHVQQQRIFLITTTDDIGGVDNVVSILDGFYSNVTHLVLKSDHVAEAA